MKYRKFSKLFFFVCVFLSASSAVYASLPPLKRTERQEMRTSVAIPCCGKHFQHLDILLHYYAEQTRLPDEVVISLSDVEKIKPEELDKLEQFSWPFVLKIVKKQGRESAGGNRNIAVEHCTSEVILFQDADDIPHPQRVEIVKFVFENYEVDHLLHLWLGPEFPFTHYAPQEVELVHHSRYYGEARDVHLILNGWRSGTHPGNICLTRELALRNQWESVFGYDKDVPYNAAIYAQPIRTVVARVPLLIYRNALSSFKEDK